MATGHVFSGIRPALPLMGRDLNLINGYEIFFLTRDGFGYCPISPRPVYI